MKKSNLKFYPLKIYCIAIFLNLIPNFALIAQDWSSNDRKLMGGVYLVFLLVIYVPFLFISKEKSISKILFFLPSIITVVLLSVFFVVKTELETLLFCLVIIIPNLLLQGLIFLYHYKKIKHQYIKLFKLISLTVFILLIGMVIPFSIASNISNDKTTQYVFRAGFVLVLFYQF